MDDPVERWLPVVGHEGAYEVSDHGRVRGLRRTIMRPIGKGLTPNAMRPARVNACELSPGVGPNGYPTVSLSKRSYCLHDLVLSAFRGPRPLGNVGRHLDGDKLNNRLTNLAWGTYAENAADMLRHGRRVVGEAYPTAKLTDRTAAEIRALRGTLSQSELAYRYSVSPAAVQAVHDGRTWKHVPSLPADIVAVMRAEMKRRAA